MNKWVIASLLAASSVTGAVITDLSAFKKAREKNPNAKFDFVLAVFRYIQAGLAVALPALGIAAMEP